MADIETILKSHISEEVQRQGEATVEKLRVEVMAAALEGIKKARPIEITRFDGTKGNSESVVHEATEDVLHYISARLPVLLVGPAGSGKTQIAIICAKLLGIPYYSISVNEQTSKSDFLGYKDANGKLVETNFRKAFENGGVFIIDEIDAGNPNILTVVNSALSNDMCPFPDGMIPRHKDFVCVCTANTFGEGESLQYIGRNILDAATRDRFASIYIDYSETLEKVLIPKYRPLIVDLRAHFKKNNILHVISTRSGIRLEMLGKVKSNMTGADVVHCLNLQQEVNRDSNVVKIIKKYAAA